MIHNKSLIAAAFLLAAAALPSHAQTDLAAAKAEGRVVWYTSTPIETAQKVVNLFQAKTGIPVEMFRSGGSAVMRRFQLEQQANRVFADVLTTSDPAESTALAAKGAFLPFKPEHFDKIPESAKEPSGLFVGQRLNMITIYYRHDRIAEEDGPKTMKDLLQPQYKGQLVMADPSFTSLQLAVVGMTARNLGWEFYEQLRKNDIMIVQGGQQTQDMVKRGERLVAAGASDSYAADARLEGRPFTTVYPPDGTFLIPSPSAVVARSPHPNAAKLFAEFLISTEAQKIFPEVGGYSSRIDVPAPAGSPPLADIKLLAVDYDYIQKNASAIKRRFNDIFQ
jgi:iron(III) transport system substrate-binding protein